MSVGTDVVDELTAVLDRLVEVDPDALADGETVVALNRQLERLAAVNTRVTAAFDASRRWEACGARTAAAWLGTQCLLPMPTARRRVHLGRTLRHLPVAEKAWLDGEVSEAQVGLVARAHKPATVDALARDEEFLVGEAARLPFRFFARAMAYWRFRADAEGVEADATTMHDSRRFHLSQSFGGMFFTDGAFDPIGGTIVSDELKRLENELFEADWAEAKARVGEGVCANDLARTPAQRRADALVEMATRSATSPAGGRRPEPLFSVMVGYETFAGTVCELAGGSVVSPGSLRPWLDRAAVERVVFDGPSRVIDVGERRRFFTGATRRAVQVRDGECFHPYCDTPAADCDIDHELPWTEGGLTTQDNGRLACGVHNRGRHKPP